MMDCGGKGGMVYIPILKTLSVLHNESIAAEVQITAHCGLYNTLDVQNSVFASNILQNV